MVTKVNYGDVMVELNKMIDVQDNWAYSTGCLSAILASAISNMSKADQEYYMRRVKEASKPCWPVTV